jgi:hypothetical protein
VTQHLTGTFQAGRSDRAGKRTTDLKQQIGDIERNLNDTGRSFAGRKIRPAESIQAAPRRNIGEFTQEQEPYNSIRNAMHTCLVQSEIIARLSTPFPFFPHATFSERNKKSNSGGFCQSVRGRTGFGNAPTA